MCSLFIFTKSHLLADTIGVVVSSVPFAHTFCYTLTGLRIGFGISRFVEVSVPLVL
jgi:hypothetical protein